MNFIQMKKIILFQLVFLMITSCNTKNNQIESPLISVIKLESAEALADFTAAKEYIDVKKAYTFEGSTITPDSAWKELVLFNYKLARDKKFTNVFAYHDYNIEENVNANKAEIIFTSKEHASSVKKIIYNLELTGNKWVVVKIDYVK
jgi:hypothetical protein